MERDRDVRPRAGVLAILSGAIALAAAASAFADQTPEQIVACVRANFPEQTAIARIELSPRDRLGRERTVAAVLRWKREARGSRVLLRAEAPPDLRDTAVLLIERAGDVADLFMYVPEMRKTRRITSQMLHGSLFGSDFSYEDFRRFLMMAAVGRAERLPDVEVDGVAAFVVAHHPAADVGSAYDRIVTYVEKARCIPLRTEMWEESERLRKVLFVDRHSILEEGRTRMPRVAVMRDLERGTESRLEASEIRLGVAIPSRNLDLKNLGR